MAEVDIETDVELIPIESLIPYSNNPKEHPESQIKKIASSIKNYGWDVPIVVDEDNEIIKGHGRMMAAKLLGLEKVPVIHREDLSDAEARASRIADNKTHMDTGWDIELLSVEVDQLIDDIGDMADVAEMSAFDEREIDAIITGDTFDIDKVFEEDSNGTGEGRTTVSYTDKIKTPVYEPTGREPDLTELYDINRYRALLGLIEDADLDKQEREFFKLAAQRHIIFDYENIAEYFAHQDAKTQELMEELTLVILDFEEAIEQGFVNFIDSVLTGESK